MSKRAHEPDESAVAELPEAKRARRAAGGGVDRRWITAYRLRVRSVSAISNCHLDQ
jgi:hypothetical protein